MSKKYDGTYTLTATPTGRRRLVEKAESEFGFSVVGAEAHFETHAVKSRDDQMHAPINGALVIIPSREPLVPEEASVQASHQLNPIKEIDSPYRSRVTFNKHKTFFKRQERFVNAQMQGVRSIEPTERICTTMVEVIVTFDIARAQTH